MSSISPENFNDTELLDREPMSQWARPIFKAWEKLRVVYNIVLVFVTLLTSLTIITSGDLMANSAGYIYSLLSLAGITIVGAVVANICFFAGPIMEVYPIWIGSRIRIPRLLIFISGTLFASLLAVCALYDVTTGLNVP